MRFARGYSLIELCLVLAIGAGVVGGAMAFISQNAEFQSRSWALTEIDSLRSTILESLVSDAAWENTLASSVNASAMECLRAGASCDSVASGTQEIPFAVYDINNRLLVNSTNLSSGFTENGSVCDGFSLERGNDLCPFRFQVTWRPSCRSGDCVNPLIKISAMLLYSPAKAKRPINTDRYSILDYYRDSISRNPTCQGITHSPNSKSFQVSWTAGARNGGVGGCTVQFQRNDASWADAGTVNCDAPGSAAGSITLPGDHWLGGAWSQSVNVRLRRNSDGTVLCALGRLTCTARGGSTVSTPTIDEDCNSEWNNSSPGGICSGSASISRTPGDTYSCPPVLAKPCGNLNFARSVTFTTTLSAYSSYTCGSGTNMGLNGNTVSASSEDLSGTIPDSGKWMYGGINGVATIPLNTPPCSGAYPGGIYITLNGSGWQTAQCHYHSVNLPGLYF